MMQQKGFTLLELLIAIVLLAFITFATISITENSFTTKETVTSEDNESLQIESAMARLEWDVAHLYTPLFYENFYVTGTDGSFNMGVNPNDQGNVALQSILQRYQTSERFALPSESGKPVPRFQSADKSTFEFFTIGNRRTQENSKMSRFSWVKYSISDIQDPDGTVSKSLVRTVMPENVYDPRRPEEGTFKSHRLLDHVTSLEFSFWDPTNRRFVHPLEGVLHGESLLRAVKIDISWRDSLDIEHSTSRIYRVLWPLFKGDNTAASAPVGAPPNGTPTPTP